MCIRDREDVGFGRQAGQQRGGGHTLLDRPVAFELALDLQKRQAAINVVAGAHLVPVASPVVVLTKEGVVIRVEVKGTIAVEAPAVDVQHTVLIDQHTQSVIELLLA